VNRASIIDLHTTAHKTCSRNQMTLPDALDHIQREIDLYDGYPTQCIGAGPSTSRAGDHEPEPSEYDGDDIATTFGHTRTTKTTSVEAAANRGASTQRLHNDITTTITKISKLGDHLSMLLAQALPKPSNMLCNGGLGRDGHITGWGRTDCGKHVDHEGMCNAHIADERRWRASVGKPERIIEHGYLEHRGQTQDTRGRFTAA
jgi:hypothetical protein